MKILSKIFFFLVSFGFLSASVALATSVDDIVTGMNITAWDHDSPPAYEDNEVEPNMQQHQKWDFEAMYWDPGTRTLYVAAGFKFFGETEGNGIYWAAGDVFLFGSSAEYALDFARTGDAYTGLAMSAPDPQGTRTGSFDVYTGNSGSYTSDDAIIKPYYSLNDNNAIPYARDDHSGSKWADGRWIDTDGVYGGDQQISDNVSYTYYSGLTGGVNATAWMGVDTHYVLALNLAGINFAAGNYSVHMTMECGNDVIRGDLTMPTGDNPVPEPATMLLFGTGLIGLAGFGRKKLIKK